MKLKNEPVEIDVSRLGCKWGNFFGSETIDSTCQAHSWLTDVLIFVQH